LPSAAIIALPNISGICGITVLPSAFILAQSSSEDNPSAIPQMMELGIGLFL
jgi:hypothetical protein